MEGTCAAWLAEQALTQGIENVRDLVGQCHPENGWEVGYEMANHVQGYVNVIRSRPGKLFVEGTVTLSDDISGTPDAYVVGDDGTVYVDDLKYGYGIVEPDSAQIAIYAGAVCRSLSEPPSRIVVGVYQPRAYHFNGVHRTITFTHKALEDRIAWIEARAQEALSAQALAVPGRQCKYCEAAHVCPAIATELYDNFTFMSQQTSRNMTPKELSEELEFIDKISDMVKGRSNAITAEATSHMERGISVPGWQMSWGVGNRRWTAPAEIVEMVTGIDPKGGTTMTPAELERRGADPILVNMLTETPRTKAKLTRVNRSDIMSRFGKASGENDEKVSVSYERRWPICERIAD
jgi:hypothetical protein